jgi:hypothetical protein
MMPRVAHWEYNFSYLVKLDKIRTIVFGMPSIFYDLLYIKGIITLRLLQAGQTLRLKYFIVYSVLIMNSLEITTGVEKCHEIPACRGLKSRFQHPSRL